MIRIKKYCGEKVKYSDGVGCCIWLPFDEVTSDGGLAYDFPADDIDELIELLQALKKAEAEEYHD